MGVRYISNEIVSRGELKGSLKCYRVRGNVKQSVTENPTRQSEDSHWPCFTSDCCTGLLCFLMKVHILADGSY